MGGEFPLAMLWKSRCNLGKIYDIGEDSNTQNTIHILFCNLSQAILRVVTLTMRCAFLKICFLFILEPEEGRVIER